MKAEQIILALKHGAIEENLVKALDVSHLEFRQYCLHHHIELDFRRTPLSLQTEVNHHIDFYGWSKIKVAKRYSLPLTTVLAIMYDNRAVPKDDPPKDMIEHLLEHHYTIKDMAEYFKISTYKVKKLLEQYDLTAYKVINEEVTEQIIDMLLDEIPPKDIARVLKVSYTTVYNIKREQLGVKEYKPHGKASMEEIKTLHEKGYTQAEIARELNISQATVSRKLK